MLSLTAFAGEIPKLLPRLLPDGFGQIARNCKLVNGGIKPYRQPADFRVVAPGNVVFFKRGSTWFEWSKLVDVAPAPIASNRLYVTGDGAPKIVVDSSTILPLAVPRPAAKLLLSTSGTLDAATQTTILYTYTYVTFYDEESEPAPLSDEILRSPGMNINITNFAAPPTNRAINRVRLYRSQTSASGTTELYFIAELPLPTPATYIDNPEATSIQEPIPSLYYNPPPDDLQGIIALPNGMMAAFAGKKLYFSEPWKPHAWPEKYVLTTNFDIVGLGAFGQSIAVMTTGNPYVVTGVAPDAMVMERLEVNFPCLTKRGIVDLGYSVAYPAPDGLVTISAAGAQLVSRKLISRDDWLTMDPANFVSSQYEGRYMAAYSFVDRMGTRQVGTIIIDLTGEQPFISRLDDHADFMFYEIGEGKLFLLKGGVVTEFDALSRPFMSLTWRSKQFVHSGHVNYGALFVEAEDVSNLGDPNATPKIDISDASVLKATFPTTDSGSAGGFTSQAGFEATVYADGRAVRTIIRPNVVERLPGNFRARVWEIEFRGGLQINAAALAWSPSEMATMGQGGVP